MTIELSPVKPSQTLSQGDDLATGLIIELVEGYGEWFVHTLSEDRTVALSRFDSECFAFTHAETERARLGVGSVFRV